MVKLRHVAISVPDLQKAEKFYEEVFNMQRLRESKVAVNLSDGVINLTLLRFPTNEMTGDERGNDYFGVHQIGFHVEDADVTGKRVVDRGGIHMGKAPSPPGVNAKENYRDPDGVVFDLSEHGWEGTSKLTGLKGIDRRTINLSWGSISKCPKKITGIINPIVMPFTEDG